MADPWQELYEAAEEEAKRDANRKGEWWDKNPNGWCPACHRHRFNADYNEGRCYVCGSLLTEVKSELGQIATRQMYSRSVYGYCDNCRASRAVLPMDNNCCYVCHSKLAPHAAGYTDTYDDWYDDDDGKEVWWTMKPDILVAQDAHAYVMQVVAECPGEVGGLGYCERMTNGDLRIYEFALIKQEVSGSGVEFDDDAMHEFLTESAKRGDNENLRVSWHSHGNMACYFSATDTGDAIPKYKAAGIPWLLSLIFNRKGEIKTRLDVFDSEALDQIYLEDLAYMMERPQPIIDKAVADVKELVHERKWQSKNKQGQPANKSKADEGKKKDAKKQDESEASTALMVPPKGRRGKQERKRLRRSLAARSDFSAAEIGEMEIEEVIECLAYINLMHSREGGHGVVTVGDDLPDEFNGKKVADLTEREWVAYCEANEIALDPASKRMLLAKADDEWGGVV